MNAERERSTSVAEPELEQQAANPAEREFLDSLQQAPLNTVHQELLRLCEERFPGAQLLMDREVVDRHLRQIAEVTPPVLYVPDVHARLIVKRYLLATVEEDPGPDRRLWWLTSLVVRTNPVVRAEFRFNDPEVHWPAQAFGTFGPVIVQPKHEAAILESLRADKIGDWLWMPQLLPLPESLLPVSGTVYRLDDARDIAERFLGQSMRFENRHHRAVFLHLNDQESVPLLDDLRKRQRDTNWNQPFSDALPDGGTPVLRRHLMVLSMKEEGRSHAEIAKACYRLEFGREPDEHFDLAAAKERVKKDLKRYRAQGYPR